MPETISQAVANVRKLFNLDDLNEEDTKLYVVERLLENLGWNLRDPREIKREYRVGKDRADYALNPDSPTAVFIEIKKPAVHLENHQRQLLNYCFQQVVNLAVLTNGRTWWLYLPRYEGIQEKGLHWSEKRFSKIDITNGRPSDIQKEFERFLTKEKVSSGEAVEYAKARIDEKVRITEAQKGMLEAWNQIVVTPHNDLIGLLRNTSTEICGFGVSGQWVKEFLKQHRSEIQISSGPAPQPPNSERVTHGSRSVHWTFNGENKESNTWKSALAEFCELIHKQYPNKFEKILNVRGRTLSYFSMSRGDLEDPLEIGGTGYYVHSFRGVSTQIIKACKRVAIEFGHSDYSFNAQ